MHSVGLALQGAWRVLLASLLFGAGLPAVFALGVRSLAWNTGGSQPRPHPAGRVLAGVLFAVVLAGIAIGIVIIVAAGLGKSVSFEHIYPTLVPKKK